MLLDRTLPITSADIAGIDHVGIGSDFYDAGSGRWSRAFRLRVPFERSSPN